MRRNRSNPRTPLEPNRGTSDRRFVGPLAGARPSPPPTGWWEESFALKPTASDLAGHRCGQHQMLTLIAYDITDQKRLHKVAQVCEDWGVRVQYSVFECRLEADAFDRFWSELKDEIDEADDRLVAYKICLNCARDIRCAGTMVTSEKVVAYVC
jgi:CRISPR-associated protein Cas2